MHLYCVARNYAIWAFMGIVHMRKYVNASIAAVSIKVVFFCVTVVDAFQKETKTSSEECLFQVLF